MPIPGDNGQPKKEREEHAARIDEVAKNGANLKEELNFKPSEKTNFGNIK